MLEPYEAKVSRTVLRRGRTSNRSSLFGDEAIQAREEILNVFNADTSDEAIRRLAI